MEKVFTAKTSSDSSVRLSVFLIDSEPNQVIFFLGETLNCDWDRHWNWWGLLTCRNWKGGEPCFTVCHVETSGRSGWGQSHQTTDKNLPYFLAHRIAHFLLFGQHQVWLVGTQHWQFYLSEEKKLNIEGKR